MKAVLSFQNDPRDLAAFSVPGFSNLLGMCLTCSWFGADNHNILILNENVFFEEILHSKSRQCFKLSYMCVIVPSGYQSFSFRAGAVTYFGWEFRRIRTTI